MYDCVIDIEDQIKTDREVIQRLVERLEYKKVIISFKGEKIDFEQEEYKTRDGLKIMCKFGDSSKKEAMSGLIEILFEMYCNSIGNKFELQKVDDSYQAKIITFGGEKN